MRLSAAQLELLRQSARQPGRPPSLSVAGASSVRRITIAASESVELALIDAYRATEENRPRRVAPGAAPHAIKTEDDAAAVNDSGWRPIATAPVLRDVEIRTADILGSYALLYPCRYVPEQGWINAILRTPLTVPPVEWREWAPNYMDSA